MAELKAKLLKEAQRTDPSSDVKSRSTLKDFQRYFYRVADAQEDSDLKKVSIKKTICSINISNTVQRTIDDTLENMLVDFTKAMLAGCTRLRVCKCGLVRTQDRKRARGY
jgi:CRISPR/Cas system CSM-associated protein Csm2 small subunit